MYFGNSRMAWSIFITVSIAAIYAVATEHRTLELYILAITYAECACLPGSSIISSYKFACDSVA